MRRRIARLGIIVMATYLAVCMFVTFWQEKLIYFPDRRYHSVPSDLRMPFSDLRLRTDDGIIIVAWHVPPPAEGAFTVIFAHGNAGNLSDRLDKIRQLHRMGCGVLAFDYRGYGGSEGRPGEEGTYLDALAAYDHLTGSLNVPAQRIIAMGESLGGAVAIELARRRPIAALAVECTFTSLADIGKAHYPLLPVGLLLRHRYDSLAKIDAITCPKLVAHARNDTLVPFDQARKLVDRAAQPKDFLETDGDHNTGGFFYNEESVQYLSDWLSKL